MPIRLIKTSGRERHIRPLPSDSTTQTDASFRDRKIRAADPDFHAQEFFAQVVTRRIGQVLGLDRPVRQSPILSRKICRISIRLRCNAGTTMWDGLSSPS